MTVTGLEAEPRLSDWRRVMVGDARNLETMLPIGAVVDLTITSPPYWDAVDYGSDGQIGFGQTHEQYLADMALVFAALHGKTADSGSLWLIVDTVKAPSRSGVSRLVPLPFELAAKAEACGWILHDIAVWRKDRTLPWSREGRLRNGFEYILFLVKGPGFKYHLDRIRSIDDLQDWWKRYPERYHPLGAAPTNVWDFPIPVQGSWSNGLIRHQCPLPRGLVRRIVELCSDPDDVVFDPFAGVGTVPAVAAALGRNFVGIELAEQYVEQFYSAVLPEVLNEIGNGSVSAQTKTFATLITRLRLAKLPRVLGRGIRASGVQFAGITAIATLPPPHDVSYKGAGHLALTLFVPDDADTETAKGVAERLMRKAPLSKFGVQTDLEVARVSEWRAPEMPSAWSKISLDDRSPVPYEARGVPSFVDPLVLVNIPSSALALDGRSG